MGGGESQSLQTWNPPGAMDSPSTASSPLPIILRYIKDPIHDQIPITPKLAAFIDTPQFQRLRNLKQLGATSWVWPSATHTRFEHSLGVAYLARLIASHLQKNQPELKISDLDIDCVEIAGLCHDLGHGPWSHVWDRVFIPTALPDSAWKHEHASEMMFDALVRDNDVMISEGDQKFVKALISGDASRSPYEDKEFLFDIVANQRNGLDVDKIDYIHRDSHMIGEAIHHSPLRLINSARVHDKQICYNFKDANQIYDLCASRFRLHKSVYNHKSAKAIEHMLVDALMAAEPVLKFARHIDNPQKFLYLTDHIMSQILSSEQPELAESRRIFNRILKRDLYRCVDYKVVDWPIQHIFRENITDKEIFKLVSVRSISGPSSTSDLQESDIIVDFAEMHFGKKEKNPLDFMRFYSKQKPDVCRKAERGCYSNVQPQYFSEFLLRVYTKKAEFAEVVQKGYRDILDRLEEKFPDDVGAQRDWVVATAQEESGSAVPTPPATEAPTTPKASGSGLHSRNASFSHRASGGESPFANNKFTDYPKLRSVSPTRDDPELLLKSTPVAMNPNPSPAPMKRGRQDQGSPQKVKRRKK